ncbi:MAG: hypothetical protein IK147_02125 [Clostridia bacterium]|nr:hypothetical protein [Clostridia bacterium]
MQKHSTHKTCCVIGHREIEITEKLKREIYGYIENLIVNERVETFLFGSKSEFDDLCNGIVTKLKERYPYIKRVGYTCLCETVTLEKDKETQERILSDSFKREVRLYCVDEERESKKRVFSGKGAYVERNCEMIDDSDYCLFYYNKKYRPRQREYGSYTGNSGTAVAYEYAERKNKTIKNFYEG